MEVNTPNQSATQAITPGNNPNNNQPVQNQNSVHTNNTNNPSVMKGLIDVFKDKRIKMKDLFKSNKIKV